MDWFPPEPTLDGVRWQLDRLVYLRLTGASADQEADYDRLCALERRLLEKQNLAPGPAGQDLHMLRAFMAPVRRVPSARGCGWRRTTPRRSPEGSTATPFEYP